MHYRPTLVVAYLITAVLAGSATAQRQTPDNWVRAPIEAEKIKHKTFRSAAVGKDVSYLIYTPAEYGDQPDKRYPVMYWLHGLGGGQRGVPHLVERFDQAIGAGKTPPMLVVFVNGLRASMYCDSSDGRSPVESMIVEDLVPHVDRSYRTIAKREGRLVEGFSMGGFGAAHLGFKFLDHFGTVSSLAGALHDADSIASRRRNIFRDVFGEKRDYFQENSPWRLAEIHAEQIQKRTLLRFIVGDQDPTLEMNRSFHQHLTKLNIKHEFEVMPNVRHNHGQIYDRLSDRNWEFYRRAFAQLEADE